MESGKKYILKNTEAEELFESKHSSNKQIISFIKNKGFITTIANADLGIYFEDDDNDLCGNNFIDAEEFEFFKELNNAPPGVKVENELRIVINTTVNQENYKELITFLRANFE